MIIDLSIPLSNDTPVYPGDPAIAIRQTSDITNRGSMGHALQLGTHSGTHIDAPAHMIDGAPTLNELPIEAFVGTGKVVTDMSVLGVDLAHVERSDIVLFNTGTAARLHDASYFTDFPVLPVEVCQYLVSLGVKMVGLDTCSADNTPEHPVHRLLLGAGIPIIENLTNLDALIGKTFEVYALPLALNVDGAPARVVAKVLS